MDNGHRIVLVGNATYVNRGCEAIIRGTTRILTAAMPTARIVSVDFGARPDREKHETNPRHLTVNIGRFSPAWFARHAARAVGASPWFPYLGRVVNQADVVLAVGGDNYSMDYGSLRPHLAVIDHVVMRRKPFVIWGASVGPFNQRGHAFERSVAAKLDRATAIMVREDISRDYLEGLNLAVPVMRMADPAFLMEPRPPSTLPVPADILDGAVGINWSPLFSRKTFGSTRAGGIEFARTVSELVSSLDRRVVCIPHVFKVGNDDYLHMRDALGHLIDDRRVFILPPTLTAAEYKWLIARMAVFIGARTHTAIAALSSGVPTLSLAYSVKARGIARDMFGHEDFVLGGRFVNSDTIAAMVSDLMQDAAAVRNQLISRMTAINEEARVAGLEVRRLAGGGR